MLCNDVSVGGRSLDRQSRSEADVISRWGHGNNECRERLARGQEPGYGDPMAKHPLHRFLAELTDFREVTQQKAEAAVRDLVRSGEASAEQAQDLVADLVDRSRRNQARLVRQIDNRVREQLTRVRVATQADIARIERRIDALAEGSSNGTDSDDTARGDRKRRSDRSGSKTRVAGRRKSGSKRSGARRAGSQEAAAEVSAEVMPEATTSRRSGRSAANRPAAAKAPAKKAAAKKAPAKKAAAKKSAAKKAPAKKAGTKKAAAKKAAANRRSGARTRSQSS